MDMNGIGSTKIVDLSVTLSERLPCSWPGHAIYTHKNWNWFEERNQVTGKTRSENPYQTNFLIIDEHCGTHFDAPTHWISGRELDDVASVPARRLIAPAAVLDFSAEASADPDFLLEIDHIQAWESEHGDLPEGGWLLYRTGWDTRSGSQEAFTNADDTGPHTPGMSVECARWVAQESAVLGVGVETVGTDAGAAHSFDPPFPCHSFLMGSDKYGLTQLQNLSSLPPTGSVLIAGPLPIVTGSGAPARVLALVAR